MKTTPLNHWKIIASLICLASLIFVRSASAAVLFSDNYTATSNQTPNDQINNAGRQGGTLAPLGYIQGGNVQIGNVGTLPIDPGDVSSGDNFLAAFGGSAYVNFDFSIVTGPIEIDFKGVVSSAASSDQSNWVSFNVGNGAGAPFVNSSAVSSILFRANGGTQLFNQGAAITGVSGFAPGLDAWTSYKVILSDTAGTGSAFVGNGSRADYYANGSFIGTFNMNQLTAGTGFIGFSGGNINGYDNVTISGTLPSVIAPALVTDVQPRRSEVITGAPWSLSVAASGTPLNYQWYNQGGPIGGATTNSYIFNAVAGTSSYYCIITNTSGSVTSSVATVISAPNFVTVNNFSFENGSTPAFGNGSIPLQWTSFNGDWAGVSSGAAQFSPAIIPDGTQYLAVNTGPSHSGASGVYQDVGALQPNTTYTLTVAIGRGDNNGVVGGNGSWSPGSLSLLNGTDDTGTVLATTTGYPATSGTWQDYTATFTTGPTVSGDLVIELGVDPASTYQSLFDNVRLTTGTPTAVLAQTIQPAHAETFVGDQVVFTAAYTNDPPSNLQWVQITSGSTNLVNTGVVNVTSGDVTTSTLTFNNVQPANTGYYVLEAINATNSGAIAYSPLASLLVSTPATVGNVIQNNSGQAGSLPFYPAWSIDTNSDLIFGFSLGAGNAIAGAGNFSKEVPLALDPSVLSDGNPNSDRVNMVSCGWANAGGGAAGASMTYTLPVSTYGYNLTNITVYGGWADDGRNEQKYQVLYSTVGSSGPWISIGTFDYNPSFSDSVPNATRVILVPLSGALAQNVVAVQVNFNMSSKNNWNGYSEITVGGTPALGVIPALTQDISPLTAEDVVGSTLTMTGAFSGATSYQWQKNGTNLVGQTSPTLALSNLQPSDTATNGGYRLLGVNVAGTNFTRGCTVMVDPAPVATNNIVTAFAIQTSDAGAANPFSCTWDTTLLNGSLIANQNPPSLGFGTGNFNDPDVNYPNTAGGLPVLTDGSYGTFTYDGSHVAFATCGTPVSNAGQYVTYLLGADANGYDVTNIQIAGGWNDNGRDSQYYTILYSTVSNTNLFLPLASVTKNLSGYGINDSTVVRTTLTPGTGVLASNVYAIEVDFQYPQGVPNQYSGYSEISVFGSPSATAPPAGPVITLQHEETTDTFVLETPNLIANQLPSSHGAGVFTEEGCNVTNLTDGVLGFGFAYGASCGDDGTAVPWIIFNSASGWDLTNIVVYTLWNDYGRDGQFYNVSYSTLEAPTTFLPLASVAYNPFVPSGVPSGNRVAITPAVGQTLLASNVAALKFDFTPQGSQDFGWSGYSEIVLQGSNLAAPTAPVVNPVTVSGGNLILTGTGAPNFGYTVLTTTNLLTPLANWTISITGVTDGAGAFSNSIPINVTNPASFFRVRMP